MIMRLILVLLALAAVFGGIFYWKQRQEAAIAEQAGPPPPATVASATVEAETWQRRLSAVGSLVATQGIYVTNELPGLVEAIEFRSGEAVEPGDVLVRLDAGVDRAELNGLLADRRLAELQFERAKKLYERGNTAKANLDEARARLERVKADVAAKRATIRKKTIRAPFAGRLGIRQVDIGQYVDAGAEMVLLQRLDPIYVDFSLPEQHFARIAEDQSVEVRVRPHPGEIFVGRVTAVNPGVSRETRNFRVRGRLANPELRLRPGMFAEVRVLLDDDARVRTLPRTAITYNPYGDSVFVIREVDGGGLVVERRQVATGEVRDGRVAITEGLETGARVVAAGQVKLRNGQPVRIDNSVELAPETAAP